MDAAHRRGIEAWGWGTLFDWGVSADSGGYIDYALDIDARIRHDHPEWVPVDRHGLLRQSGPIELAYPEARRALVDLFMRYVRRDDYDGVILSTYCENYGLRFDDEFGFNEPIVREFKRRYGIDIRTQPFNKAAWYELRGEYVTAFLQEFKAALAQQGKKLGLFVNPRQPHFPQPWNVSFYRPTAGHIYMDVERWDTGRDGG